MGASLEAFRRVRFREGVRCPHCAHHQVHGWGHFADRRRYRCLGCRRTFSDLTGTPHAHLKKVHVWFAFLDDVVPARTLRRTAADHGIHLDTAFRWRHRLLDALREGDVTMLQGNLGLGYAFFPYSEKGSRRLQGVPRVRGIPYLLQSSVPTVWVQIVRDAERTFTFPTGFERASLPVLEKNLLPRLERGCVLATREGPLAPVGAFARSHGFTHRQVSVGSRGDVEARIFEYRSRLKRWMFRFHGVATRYLPNYLVLHRFTEAVRGLPSELVRASLMAAAFP